MCRRVLDTKCVCVQDFGTFTSPQVETATPTRSGAQKVQTSLDVLSHVMCLASVFFFAQLFFFQNEAVLSRPKSGESKKKKLPVLNILVSQISLALSDIALL